MKEKLKKLAPWLVVVVLGLALVGGAKAASGFSWEVVMDKVADKLANRVPNDAFIGADDGTHITKLSVLDTLDVTSTATFDGAVNVGGAVTFNGSLTTATDTRAVSFVETGSAVVLTTTTVLTAAQVCNNRVIIARPVSDSGIDTFTVTLPNSSTLFADCLTTNGDSLEFSVYNQSSITSTLLAAGTGGPASASSTLLIQRADTRVLKLFRTSTIGYVLKAL